MGWIFKLRELETKEWVKRKKAACSMNVMYIGAWNVLVGFIASEAGRYLIPFWFSVLPSGFYL